MNEEREDTELAELLKQLPAPTRLDDARRNAIFTALPQGCAPRRITFVLARAVQYAAVAVLVVGVLASLILPSFVTKRSIRGAVQNRQVAVKPPSGDESSIMEQVAFDGLCDMMEMKPDEGDAQSPANFAVFSRPLVASDVSTPPAAAAPEKSAESSAPGSRCQLPQEKKLVGDKPMDPDAFAKALAERSPDIDLKEAYEPPPPAPQPAEIRSVGIVKSPIIMRGIVGSRTSGQRGRALPGLDRVEESPSDEKAPAAGYTTASAAEPEPLPEPEMADKAEAVGMDDLTVGIASGAKLARRAAVVRERRNAPQVQQPQSAEGMELPRQEAREKADAQLQTASDGSTMAAQKLAKAVDSDEYVYYTEGTTFKAKRKRSGESLRSEQRASEVAAQVGSDVPEEALPSVSDARDSAADPFGGSLSAGKAEVADSEASAEDWKGFFSELGVEWPKNPDGSPVTLGVGLREAEAKPQSDGVRQRRQPEAELTAELARLEKSRSDLLDEYRKELEEEEEDTDSVLLQNEIDARMKDIQKEELEKKPQERSAPVDFGPFTLIPTAEHPLSTFGLDVDSAGYSRAVSLIDEGARPDAATIRQEEFINAFDYGDLAPAEATFRVYLEGAASPFRPGNHLLRVGVKGRRLGREEQRPLRLAILLDASGSMETPERMALAKRAIEALLATLSPGDTVTLLTCSDKTRKIFVLSGWDRPETARRAGDELAAVRCQGATNLEDGIIRAFESASADFAPEAENRVVILSDGIANLGSANAEEILAKVAANRDRGINCSVIGVGRSTYNDALLEAMANRGNGQYRFLDSEASIHESFVEDLQNSFNTIAADVKIQVEWNLGAVKAYRSHGYDSRALKDEQFRDDSVDAGEVGSGQGVTVVYEMQLAEGLKPGATLGTVRIRYRRIDTGAVEEIEAPIAAEAVQRDFVRARSQFRLASAVAEFATVLKHVPPAAQANALQPVAAEAVRVAAELDYYAPARGFADAVLKLMTLGL